MQSKVHPSVRFSWRCGSWHLRVSLCLCMCANVRVLVGWLNRWWRNSQSVSQLMLQFQFNMTQSARFGSSHGNLGGSHVPWRAITGGASPRGHYERQHLSNSNIDGMFGFFLCGSFDWTIQLFFPQFLGLKAIQIHAVRANKCWNGRGRGVLEDLWLIGR